MHMYVNVRKERVDIDILVTSRNGDRKILKLKWHGLLRNFS